MLRSRWNWMLVMRKVLFGGALAMMVMSGASVAQGEGQVRVALHIEPASLDPKLDSTGPALTVQQALFEGLVRLDDKLEVIPWLAESWEQLDEVTWRLHLREGVRFHSGNTFNAEAVAAHYARLFNPADPAPQASHVSFIEEIRVIDEYIVEFGLSSPTGAFLRSLAMPNQIIVDPQEAERLGHAIGENPSGTGPFRLREWRHGEAVILEANPDYWVPGKPGLATLHFRIIPEASSRLIALELGEVDIIMGISPHDFPRVEEDPDLVAIKTGLLRAVTYHINVQHPVLGERAVRQALAHAVDTDVISEFVVEAAGEPLRGFVSPGVFGYIELSHGYDPALSRQILEDAGWDTNHAGIYEKDGRPLRFTVVATGRYPRDVEVSELVQMELRKIGIDMQIERMEWASFFDTLVRAVASGPEAEPSFDMFVYGIGARTADAAVVLEAMYASRGGRNAGYYSNPEVDVLFEIGASGAPDEVRLDAYQTAQRLMFEDVASIPLFSMTYLGAVNKAVAGFTLHPAEVFFWEDLTTEH